MRASGILLHISSLPGSQGIGKMGKEAYAFADFLHKAKQKYWQILPVSPTSYGDSPYQSFSIHAGNPYFIDLDTLAEEGLLTPSDYQSIDWGEEGTIDYGFIYITFFGVLKKAYMSYKRSGDKGCDDFVRENEWVKDYALFMVLKQEHGGKGWYDWEKPLRMFEEPAIEKARKQYADEIGFWEFLQYEYSKQWTALKAYVNGLGIDIIGDIPIYVAYDSVEVWTHPELFLLDENKEPIDVAGCPPDVFSAKGQLWGNPLYRWDVIEEQGFKWWIDRIRSACTTYDVVRIDHFRGFESYYCIPYGREDAIVGEWRKGPGMRLFRAVKAELGRQRIIAEDLGFLTRSVIRMRNATGFPGMKIMEFAFDPSGQSMYLPHNFDTPNCVCYTGTHDNETAAGWVDSISREERRFCREYLGVKRNKDIPRALIRAAWASIADTAIAQMQDILELGAEARMNTPSTLGGNWMWRLKGGELTDELAADIARLTVLFGRAERDKPSAAPEMTRISKKKESKK